MNFACTVVDVRGEAVKLDCFERAAVPVKAAVHAPG